MAWRLVRNLGRSAAILVTSCIITGPGWSLDRLDFRVSGGSDPIVQAARDASLVASMEARGQTEPQDILAAARADYGRILAALYAKGHYSSVIRISVDGREAASISPLEIPEAISTIVISVDPGPPFRFNSVRISPLAGGTKLPAGFRTGQTAESPLVGEAVDSAIRAWRELGHA
ncbi:MAG: outer membrane protein assembly factor, partial [Tabrizicola sp.]|nr:outer membrane protein assembly factor [Tabrizicola sp.]